ncbi:MAG: glycosyltransferase [Candidatus Jordarchaeaceae archaeon]
MVIGILEATTLILLALPFFIFALYGIIILYYVKRNETENPSKNTIFNPFVSIIIPTHNEETIISKKISNLLTLKYPNEKLEIIFVDDSDDSTPMIIQQHAKNKQNIRLISYPYRMGYSPSMIAGCKAAKGEILIFGDAGSFIEPETIPNLVRHFQKPEIGAVTGSSAILNIDEQVGRSEQLYVRLMNFIRKGETMMDSTFHFNGEACAVRKKLITDIDWCDATFDTTTALHVRQKGYKTIYDPTVRFYEYAPRTHRERVRQKVTRAANLLKVLFRFKHILFKRSYGKFGCIILPINMAMLTVAPISILLMFLFLLVGTFTNFTFFGTILGFFALLFLVGLMISKEIVITFLEFEFSLIKAFFEVVFTRKTHDKIEKVSSTRRYENFGG